MLALHEIHERILEILINGEAETLYDAEETFLNESLPKVMELLASPISNEELGRHPIMEMMLAHGSRGLKDSTL